jgi:hypothetical protein
MAIEESHTTFKPSKHGFHFKNSFKGPIQGLCGGMVWAALDRYFGNVNKPIPGNTEPPEPDLETLSLLEEGQQWSNLTPPQDEILNLYFEILKRQVDCLRVYELIQKIMDWMGRPNHGHWHRTGPRQTGLKQGCGS